ncbi:uncharacterized protein MONOS_2530 [Monocercomonoides exilis]|uniref:uncharacterized protein n=1 Tax=Monocercomonoides exilis TaxID=2049356 RepID=UPI00355A304B|nr:hypothetical protein MONOS_2530 [Monocercomonoides exilis]|eukprot:MONOS_2530.1-p1 / transcript=MONOS_2530.1 / gene=MONOS_2530 / organism=Monocercomonoides_exilis_PA203 / gene_product=unspecified product / transcript_product=unspecified product / location=Mono_scaffold00052:159229-159542(-) / protein_length=91 / sequence_SO=supercontig / SO=protein_coding / is_pseudo=false
MASEAQQEAKESQTPILTRERKLDCMLNDLANSDLEGLSDELDVPCRYVRIKSEENGSQREADKNAVGSDECANERFETEQGGAAIRKVG